MPKVDFNPTIGAKRSSKRGKSRSLFKKLDTRGHHTADTG